MTKRFHRGDAPAVAQVARIKEPLATGEVELRIGNKSLYFDEWDADAIAADWNASRWSEFRKVIAAAAGDDVLLTARTAGEPFFVLVLVGGVSQGSGSGTNEVQTIIPVNDPSGGTWNAAWGGDDADIDWDATTGEVQTALEGLSSLEAGDVTVTGATGGPWIVTFAGRFAGQSVAPIVVDGANLTGGNAASIIRTVQNYATGSGGTDEQDAVDAGNVRLTDEGSAFLQDGISVGRHEGDLDFWEHGLIRFPLAVDRGEDISTAEMELVFGGFVGSGSDVDFAMRIEAADDPAFPADGYEALERPLETASVAVTIPATQIPGSTVTISGLAALVQAIVDRPDWESGNHVQFHLRATGAANTRAVFAFDQYTLPPLLSVAFSGATREIQGIALSGGPRSGTVAITLDGDTTANLENDSTAAAVQAELEALTSVGSGNVSCTGGPWPAEIICGFDTSLGNLPQMTATDTLVNGDVSASTTTQGGPSVEVIEEQRSRGPNHGDDPLNYDDGAGNFGVPENGDELFFRDGKVDVLWGLRWRSPFTVSTTTDRLLLGAQQVALWENQAVQVVNVGGALPSGLAANTTYYVRDLAGGYCRLSATRGGAPINITTAGTGTHYVGVRLARFESDGRYVGKLGLPRNNADGFPEFRPRFLEAWIDEADIATGNGSGSARCHLDTSHRPVTYHQHKSGSGTNGAPASQLLCTGSNNALLALAGELGIAIDADQAAEFASLTVRGGSVLVGPQVTAGPIERTGGTVQLLGCTVNGSVTL